MRFYNHKSSKFSWFPELKIEIMQFDTVDIDLQHKIFPKANDVDSISTVQPDSNQPNK